MKERYTDKELRILGWAVLIPRLIVMIAAIISGCYAIRMGNVIGIISGIILLVIYLLDVLYLICILVADYYNGNTKRMRNFAEEWEEALENERDLFDTTEIFDDKKDGEP